MKIHRSYIPYFFPALALLVLLPACVHKRDISKKVIYLPQAQPLEEDASVKLELPPLTVWIHGTIFFKTPKLFDKYHRNSTLVNVQELPKSSKFYSIARNMATKDPLSYDLDEFYFFCWSGHFSHKARKYAAQRLADQLINTIKKYREKYNAYPKITFITHSHGGNLALSMSKIKNIADYIHIDSLILLACPFQKKTASLIKSPIFNHIYSLYSSFDFVQVLAPQVTTIFNTQQQKTKYKYLTFSSRTLPEHSTLIQAKIKINDLPIYHTSFSQPYFASILPEIIKALHGWPVDNKKFKLLSIYEAGKERKRTHKPRRHLTN